MDGIAGRELSPGDEGEEVDGNVVDEVYDELQRLRVYATGDSAVEAAKTKTRAKKRS